MGETTILLDVLYEYKTVSYVKRKIQIEGVFENSALRRVFGPKMVKVTERWRKF